MSVRDQNGQLDAAQKDEKDQTASQGTAETAVRIPLVLHDDEKKTVPAKVIDIEFNKINSMDRWTYLFLFE